MLSLEAGSNYVTGVSARLPSLESRTHDENMHQSHASDAYWVAKLSRQRHRPAAMRVTKTRSVNNSPRKQMLEGRQKNMGSFHLQNLPHHHQQRWLGGVPSCLPSHAPVEASTPFDHSQCRPTRPLSWHSSPAYLDPSPPIHHGQQQHFPLVTYLPPPDQRCRKAPEHGQQRHHWQHQPRQHYLQRHQALPPTPAVCSGHTSPVSDFSPMSLPDSISEARPYYSPGPPAPWPAAARDTSFPPMLSSLEAKSDTQFKPSHLISSEMGTIWSSCNSRGAAPLTPESLPQSGQPPVRVDVTIEIGPSQLTEQTGGEEAGGEILYGMGLYDAPEKGGDIQQEFHRSTIMSLLGGTAAERKPAGKGLKLEDAWEPQASDEDDDDDGYDEDELGHT